MQHQIKPALQWWPNTNVLPDEDLSIHLNSSLYSTQYFWSYLTRFLPFVLLPPFMLTFILWYDQCGYNRQCADAKMPIEVGTRHGFCDLLLWKCTKRHKLRVVSLVLSVPICCIVECAQNSGSFIKKIRRWLKWTSNSGSFRKNPEKWQPMMWTVLGY